MYVQVYSSGIYATLSSLKLIILCFLYAVNDVAMKVQTKRQHPSQ